MLFTLLFTHAHNSENAHACRYWETMSGLALRLNTRDARCALAAAFTAAAQLIDGVSSEAAAAAAKAGSDAMEVDGGAPSLGARTLLHCMSCTNIHQWHAL